MSDYVLDPEWSFQSVTTNPSGVRVDVTIYVPERIAGPDVRELAEVAQMMAGGAFGQIERSDSRTVLR